MLKYLKTAVLVITTPATMHILTADVF